MSATARQLNQEPFQTTGLGQITSKNTETKTKTKTKTKKQTNKNKHVTNKNKQKQTCKTNIFLTSWKQKKIRNK